MIEDGKRRAIANAQEAGRVLQAFELSCSPYSLPPEHGFQFLSLAIHPRDSPSRFVLKSPAKCGKRCTP